MSQITTHVLDTALGQPAAGIEITLSERIGDQWQSIRCGTTNDDGRLPGLSPDTPLPAATYRMRFHTERYLIEQGSEAFYPYVDVVFNIGAEGEHYHIPLLLSPFGYSTYRGS